MTTSDSRFADLYDRYYGHVYAYCRRRMSVDRVDDAVADTFLTVWRRIDDVPDGEGALLWIYRVAYRVVGHVWRSTKRKRRLDLKLSSIGVEAHPAPEDYVIQSFEESQVLAAASRLSGKDEEVLRLSIWERLTIAQIAAVLEVSPNTVSQRLHRAKLKLTTEYNRLEGQPKRSRAAQEGGAW